MLPGTVVDLRRAERADLPLLAAWFGDIEVNGEYESFEQMSLSQCEKEFEAKPDANSGRAPGRGAVQSGRVPDLPAHAAGAARRGR